jgi:hypothetical protein
MQNKVHTSHHIKQSKRENFQPDGWKKIAYMIRMLWKEVAFHVRILDLRGKKICTQRGWQAS